MLDLTPSQEIKPAGLLAELRTARRVAANLTSPRDRLEVEKYIAELEQALTGFDHH